MSLAIFALRNLATWHWRNVGALAGITIAVASFVALVGLARGVAEGLLSALEARGTDAVITESGALDLMSSIVPDGLGAEIAVFPGIEAAAAELSRLTSMEDGRSVLVAAWPLGSFPWDSLTVVSGRLPDPGQTRVAVLGEGLASRTGLAVGDRFWLFHDTFEIVGIVTTPAFLTRNLVYVPLPDAQALTFRDGQATSIHLKLTRGSEEQALANLRSRFPDFTVDETKVLADNYLVGRIAETLGLTVSTVALASAVLFIFNTMATAMNARRGEIAILSAIGWARWRIVTALLLEGAIIALAAGLIGIAVGILVAHLVASRPGIEGFVAPVLGSRLFLQAFAISMLIGLLGSVVPVFRVVSRPPTEVLRGR